jgi:tetratricopeptide (TPR) repeat protein
MSLACPECGRLHSEFDPRCLDCGTPLPTSTNPEPRPATVSIAAGGRLDRFEILGELGRGGMGVVYRARDLQLGREVALKLLSHDDREVADRTRVMREARVLAALDHPAIGTLYEVGEGPYGSFLVLALYQGRTLAAELAVRGALPAAEALAILGRLAGALAAAHGAGILHRDVKPSNVFRLPDGQVKLIDFGIARLAAPGDGSASGEGPPIGTAAYMSPERIFGEPSGEAADVWSLGVLGWELASGSHPFDLERPGWLERIAGAKKERPPLPPGTPPALATLLDACLAEAPEARPSAAELAGALAEIGEQLRQPPVAPPAPAPRRPAWPWAAAAALALAAAAYLFRPEPRQLLVTVLEPQVEGRLAAGDRDRLAANLDATSWRTLLRLEGIEALDRNLARQAKGEPVAVARATAADETLAWEVRCPGVDLCSARLLRRDAAGRVLGSESLELSATGDTLSARAAAAALRRVYPELGPKGGAEEAEPSADFYPRFLELRSAIDRRQISPEKALDELAVLRAKEPPPPELSALEAGLCRFLLARDRDQKWLARGLQAVAEGLGRAPGDSGLLAARFDLLLESKQLPAAKDALQAVERSDAGLSQLLIRQARLAEAEGRPQEALARLQRLVEDRPASAFLLTLANLEQRLGRPADARRHLSLAVDRAPENAQARSQLAGLDLAEGRLAEAAEGWRQLAEKSPALDSLTNYGLVLLLSRRYAEAETAFRQALELRADHAETRINLADTLRLLGRQGEAAELYRGLVEAPPQDSAPWQLWTTRAQAFAQLGRDAEARAALAEVLRRAPENGEGAFGAALVYTLLGDAEAALAEARRATAAGAGGIWFELPFFDPLAVQLEEAGIRRAKARPQG